MIRRSTQIPTSTELLPEAAQHQLIEMWVHGKSLQTASSYRQSARQYVLDIVFYLFPEVDNAFNPAFLVSFPLKVETVIVLR